MNVIRNTLLAGWCADSIGAQMEFQNKKFSEEEVENAINFNYKGVSNVYPGQYTDDSEMEICLLEALIECQNDEYFPIETIALKYINWINSRPFDIGETISQALYDAENAEDVINNVFECNSMSESNGSLMRCVPLAIFGINKTNEQIINMVEMESELSHCNKVVSEISSLYCISIAYILKCKINNLQIDIDYLLGNLYNLITKDKIKEWFSLATNEEFNINEYNSIRNEGHVKHSFIFFIYFLKYINKYTYITSMKIVLSCGGDTDTNAKIIGNLFGAYYTECIPENILNVVLNFNCHNVSNLYFRRPKKYGIHHALNLITQLPTSILN